MAVRTTMVSRATGTRVPTAATNPTAVSSVKVEELFVASITCTDLNTDSTVAIMVDSGAAIHVCSPNFGADFPLQKLTPEETPPLRSVTDEPLKILGYRWIRFYNRQGKQLVIPFYVREGVSSHTWTRFQCTTDKEEPTPIHAP